MPHFHVVKNNVVVTAIALMVDGMDNSFDLQVDLMKLRRSVDLRIEPHPFDSMDDNDPYGFLTEIKRNGIRVE